MNIYQQNGFANRTEYLRNLAEEHGMPFHAVALLASVLGPSEDFDGLVTTIEDEVDFVWFSTSEE